MNKKIVIAPILILFSLTIILAHIPISHAQETSVSEDKIILRYRIELMANNRWKPVKDTRRFKKNDTIRFRFTSNIEGTLYVLSATYDKASLEPVFSEGFGTGLEKHLGLGTYIEAGKVGVFPDPNEGGGLRFTGKTLKERFLFVFIPFELEFARGMAAVASGAENWRFDDKTTHKVMGNSGKILFHFFELERK